jgi:hypothetical protein
LIETVLADAIAENVESLKFFAITGICNLCHGNLDLRSAHKVFLMSWLGSENIQKITEDGGTNLLISCLSSHDERIVRNAMTALFYIIESGYSLGM